MRTDTKFHTIFISVSLLLGAVVFGYIAWKLSEILILIIAAAIIAATLDPYVRMLQRYMKHKHAAAIVVVLMILPLVLMVAMIIPTFVQQIDNVAIMISSVMQQVPFLPWIFQNVDLSKYTSDVGQYLIASTSAITTFIAYVIILIFMIYYMLVDSDELVRFILFLVPKRNRRKANAAMKKLGELSGDYMRGNIFISIICTGVMLVALLLLRVPGAPVLAIFAGIMDLLPLIGAMIGAAPAVILAFTVSPLTGILTIIVYWLYQEIENDYIAPRVYNSTLRVIPFLSFVSVIMGTILFGILGAFLALPIAASVPTLVHYFYHSGNKRPNA